MVSIRAALLGCLVLACGGGLGFAQDAPAVDPSDLLRLQVVIEAPAVAPIEQEMMLVSVRGTYDARLNIALDALVQPNLRRFGWTQLGRDRWGRDVVDGRQVRTFERRLALFPQQAGSSEIGSFVHRLTLASGNGRIQHEVRSAPVAVGVQAKPVAPAWWLPAREVRLTDSWDRAPDQLAPGDLAQRTVTLEAVGVAPQFLPPAPAMAGSGLIIFAEPEERSSRATPDGPVSRVQWRWTIRPSSSAPAKLQSVTIPWFDTEARQAREVVLAPQTIGFAAQGVTPHGTWNARRAWWEDAAPAGGLVGFMAGLALLLSGRRLRTASDLRRALSRLRPRPEVGALRRAARRGDMMAIREAAREWAIRLEADGRGVSPAVRTLLCDLDRQLFAAGGGTDRRSSGALVRGILRAAR